MKLALLGVLLLSSAASAQVCSPPMSSGDPLNAQYIPSFDTNPADYPANIWTTSAMVKQRQDFAIPTAVHWGTAAAVANEFADFQVCFQAPAGGVSNLNMTLGTLTNAITGTSISSAAPTYDITTYLETYLSITTPTANSASYESSTGTWPIALVPPVDHYWGQKTTAWPINVSANNVQCAWVDVHIPTGAPSGYDAGVLYVSTGTSLLASIPVVIQVNQWQNGGYMPSTATMKSTISVPFAVLLSQQYGASGGNLEAGSGVYTNANGATDTAAAMSMADFTAFCLDFRITCDTVYPPISSNFTQFESLYGPLLNGTTGRVRQMLPGAQMTTVNAQFSSLTTTVAQNWANEFVNKGYKATLFSYVADEGGATSATFISSATVIHAASPPVATLWTTDMTGTLGSNTTNFLDLMTPIVDNLDTTGSGLLRSQYNVWLASQSWTCGNSGVERCPVHQIWSYNDCESANTCTNGIVGSGRTFPNKHIDGMPVSNRAMTWTAYARLQTSGELYFDMGYCWDPFSNQLCGNATYPGAGISDPWKNIYYSGGNGDGTLVEPLVSQQGWMSGRTIFLGVATSTPTIAPMITLMQMRDSMQDYEYLNALNLSGQGTVVTNAIATWLTTSSTYNTDPVNFGAFTGTLVTARRTLGLKMHQLTYPGGGGPW